jgi:hypothetical protein
MTKLIGLTMLLLGAAGYALAAPAVPEIDGASSSATIALVAGGLLVLRARRKK